MDIFAQHVAPRINRAEYELELIRTRKIPHALSRNDFARVGRLGERACELQESLVFLRALKDQPPGVIAYHLAGI